MQIDARQINNRDLAALGREAVGLLLSNELDVLAARFGYALAYDREPAAAIRAELAESLAAVGGTVLSPSQSQAEPVVKYFAPNDTRLLALVECVVTTDTGSGILVELIVTGTQHESHITLEQISAAA